jgi:hypothetical protein
MLRQRPHRSLSDARAIEETPSRPAGPSGCCSWPSKRSRRPRRVARSWCNPIGPGYVGQRVLGTRAEAKAGQAPREGGVSSFSPNSRIAVSSNVRPSGGIGARAGFAEVAGVAELLAGGPIRGDLHTWLVRRVAERSPGPMPGSLPVRTGGRSVCGDRRHPPLRTAERRRGSVRQRHPHAGRPALSGISCDFPNGAGRLAADDVALGGTKHSDDARSRCRRHGLDGPPDRWSLGSAPADTRGRRGLPRPPRSSVSHLPWPDH